MRTFAANQSIQAWNLFWYNVGQFFIEEDANGINYLTRILFALGVIVLSWILIKVIGLILKKAMGLNKKGPNIDKSVKFFLVTIIRSLLWIGVAFIVVGILKIDMTGAAGIFSAIAVALGLALQDLIGCMFSGMLLLQQKVVSTGEFISVSNAYGISEGTVEKIHLFFTYLNTPQGQQIVIPNSNMTKAAITNYSRLGKRRIDYDVGVAYDSDVELVKKVLSEIIDSDERILQDDVKSVYIVKLDSYSVQFRLRCWTKFEEYWPVYNDLGEKILLGFRKNNIYIPSSTDIKINNK